VSKVYQRGVLHNAFDWEFGKTNFNLLTN